MGCVKKPTIKEFGKACEANLANVSDIAISLNVSRKTIYNWLKKPSWKEVYDDVRESLLDLTESRQLLLIKGLMKLDENGNFIGWIERPSEQMIIWFEKTRGKHRGLTEKTEQELTVNASVPIRKWLEESRKERAKKEKNKK